MFAVGFLYAFLKWCESIWKEKKKKEEEEEEGKRRNEWINVIEPKYRNVPDYPEDWVMRRKEVFLRDEGRCKACGMETGRLAKTSRSGMLFSTPQLRGAHVHHIQKLFSGGNHSLSNLQLLCESCHVLKHPNREIGMFSSGHLHRRRNQKRQKH